MRLPQFVVVGVAILSLFLLWSTPTDSALVFYMSFDDFTVDTGICPAQPSLVTTAVANGATNLQSSSPASSKLGSYAVIDPAASNPITVTASDGVAAALFPTGNFNQLTLACWVKVNGTSLTSGTIPMGLINFGPTDTPPTLEILYDNGLYDGTSPLKNRLIPIVVIPVSSTTDVVNKPIQSSGCVDVGYSNDTFSSCPNLSLNAWHHIAGVYDGAAVHLYVDGQPLGLPVQVPAEEYFAFTSSVTDIIIGGTTKRLNGAIDDVRIYDTALTASEIFDLYTNSKTLEPPASLTTVEQPSNPIELKDVGELFDFTVTASDPNNDTLEYFWQDFSTSCQIVSFETPNAPSTPMSAFAVGTASIGVGVLNEDGLCRSVYYDFNITGSAANLTAQPQNGTQVYLNEYTDVSVTVFGFPVPSFQWQVRVTRQVVLINGSFIIQSLFIPIPGQTKSKLSVLNANDTFIGVPSRRAPGPITVRCAYRNTFTPVQYSDEVVVIPLNEIRPASDNGDGDGTPVAAIVVPVVVGPILLCLLCLLILLVIFLLVLARRRRAGEWKPEVSEPDYKALAYGKFLDSPPSVSKKQLAALKKLEELLLDSDYLLTRLLCDNAKATEADNVAKVITYLYAAHGEAAGLVQHFISNEVETSNKEGTLFRANSISSKMFTTYSRVIALKYVWTIFAYPVTELDHMAQVATGETSGGNYNSQTTIMGPMAMEVDPSKMEEAADEQINTLELWLVAQKLFSGMTKAKSAVPSEIRLILRHVQTEVAGKFSEQAAHKAMGGFLFLRLLCPSLMAPQVYGLLREPPNAVAQRQLILIAKVMQNLANDTLPGKKEGYMEKLNEFITSNQERLRSFYADLISHAEDGPHGSPSVPDAVKTNSLIQLHRYISVNYDKLSAVIQQEDEGLAQELQEVMDSIGNIESDEL